MIHLKRFFFDSKHQHVSLGDSYQKSHGVFRIKIFHLFFSGDCPSSPRKVRPFLYHKERDSNEFSKFQQVSKTKVPSVGWMTWYQDSPEGWYLLSTSLVGFIMILTERSDLPKLDCTCWVNPAILSFPFKILLVLSQMCLESLNSNYLHCNMSYHHQHCLI